MQFEYDPERLIEEVRKRPAIWDFDHDQYRSKEAKHKLWGEIIQEMLQSDVKMSKSQKRELELQLQKKWKSMRDCYRKYTHNPNRTRRPYLYYKQLRFLTDKGGSDETEPPVQIENESVNKNDTVGSDTDEESRLWKPKRTYKLLKSEETSDEDTVQLDYTEASYANCNENEVNVPNKVRRVTHQATEFAFASTDSRSESDDTDKMFLLSLLPHLKAIPEDRRLEAKMSMMKVLKNA